MGSSYVIEAWAVFTRIKIKSTHLAPLDRLCVAGCAGSASPPYPTGFSQALETETCFWCSEFLSAYAVDGFPAVLVLSSLGRR